MLLVAGIGSEIGKLSRQVLRARVSKGELTDRLAWAASLLTKGMATIPLTIDCQASIIKTHVMDSENP
jgi:hypothetical protein